MRTLLRRPPPVTLLAAALLVGVFLAGLAGCAGSPTPAGSSSPPGVPAGSGVPGSAGPGPTGSGPTTGTPTGATNGTDVAWLQLAIAMNERALLLFGLVEERSTDPAVRRYAAALRTGHQGELAQLRGLLRLTGAPSTNPHEGHDMPGMVTPAQLESMGAAAGTRFRQLFDQHLRAHLNQSILIGRGETSSGADPATRALADTVLQARTAQLAQLDRLP